MVDVSFWKVVDKKRVEHKFTLSRVPCIGEEILIAGCDVVVREVLHRPINDQCSVAAECYIGD